MSRCFWEEDAAADTSISAEPLKDSFRPPLTLVVTTGANLRFSYALATLINNWFYRRKAFAMSAFQAVDSFVPAVLVVILPLSRFITDSPESMGLTMDGDPPGGAPAGRCLPGGPPKTTACAKRCIPGRSGI